MTIEEIDRATRSALAPMSAIPGIFGTSLSGAYGLAARGELETVRLGRRRFVKTAPIRQKFGLPLVIEEAVSEPAAA